jgi:hypothetical protein
MIIAECALRTGAVVWVRTFSSNGARDLHLSLEVQGLRDGSVTALMSGDHWAAACKCQIADLTPLGGRVVH